MGLGNDLKKRALGASQKAVEKLLSDEKRAMKIAEAVGKVQRGKKALDKQQDAMLRSLQFASKADFKGVNKQLAGLKRRLRELESRVAKLG